MGAVKDVEKYADSDDESSRFILVNTAKDTNSTTCTQSHKWTKALPGRLLTVFTGVAMLFAFLTWTGPAMFGPSLRISTLEQAHKLLPDAHNNGSCGNSAAEARKAGCVFDLVAFSWLPPACAGDDVDDFLAVSEWKYWGADKQEVLNETAWEGDSEYMRVTLRHHMVHCTFMWKRLHRAAMLKKPTDSYVANYEHTNHCSELLLTEWDDYDEISAKLFVKFPTCGIRLDRDDLGIPSLNAPG